MIGQNGLAVYREYCRRQGKAPKIRLEAKPVSRPHRRPILSCKVNSLTADQVRRWMIARTLSGKAGV